MNEAAMQQRWVVLLGERDGRQIWLAYDNLGRIGNANHKQAFRYHTMREAQLALLRLRGTRRWPDATILGTLEEQVT